MERSVTALMLLLGAWAYPAAAQTAGAGPALDATQLAGRNLFTQHCAVCHVKTLITAVRTYGPPLSQQSLGGLDEVLLAFISTGTSSMPGFKYSLEPGEIRSIIGYLKTLPAPLPAAPTNPAPR
jgi:mono/diheme cytochrome c family protein